MTDKTSFVPSCLRVSNLLEQHFDTAFAAPDLPAGKAGGVARLRELILTLAMQGKLVAQDANDSPASELLKEIEAEKQRLVKAGKIKKPKPLPEVANEEITHEIPTSWAWVRFGDIAQHNSGKTLDKGRNTGEPRDYITTSNLYWGRFELDNVRQMLIRDDELEKCTARKNDLLICEGGEAGRAAVWHFDSEVCFQNHVHRARFYKDIDPYFAYRFFEKLNATGEINQHRKGVGISNMSSKALASIVFPLPPLPEQHRIVARIDQLMARCDALEKLRKEREEKRLAVHAAAIKQLLDTPDLSADKAGGSAWEFIEQHFGELYTVKENVAELRKAILQLAVMGRLVPPACRQAGKTPTTLPPPEAGAWWVYVIECENGSFYKGFTEDLPRRWKQHVSGTACEWTKKHPPKQVYYWEKWYSKEAAIKREDYLKSGSGREWFKREVVDNEKAWQPASELLKEIEAEKQRLAKAGKIKKPKPLPPITPEEVPYDLPQGWEWVRLGEIGDTNIGLTYSPSDVSDTGIPVLRSNNIQNGILDLADLKRVNMDVKESVLVQDGDLLICARNGSKALVGKTALVTGLNEKMAFGAFMAIFRSRVNLYLLRFINSPLFRRVINEVNTMTINQITQNNLRTTICPLPPLPEQHRIVARIDQLMALCNTLDQQIDAATGKQTALLNAVMACLSADTAQV